MLMFSLFTSNSMYNREFQLLVAVMFWEFSPEIGLLFCVPFSLENYTHNLQAKRVGIER